MREIDTLQEGLTWEPEEEVQLTSPAQELALIQFAASKEYPLITDEELRALVARVMEKAGRAP